MTWLKTILAALFGAIGDALLAWRDRRQAEAAMRNEAVLDNAAKTDDVIKETADDRAKLRPADNAADLARRLRDRAKAYRTGDDGD